MTWSHSIEIMSYKCKNCGKMQGVNHGLLPRYFALLCDLCWFEKGLENEMDQ